MGRKTIVPHTSKIFRRCLTPIDLIDSALPEAVAVGLKKKKMKTAVTKPMGRSGKQ